MRSRNAPVDELDQLFESFTREAWRWECQGTYWQPNDEAAWNHWRKGEPYDLDWMGPWLDEVRAANDAGKTIARVRVYDVPMTAYERWQVQVTPANVDAGEDIRILTRQQAQRLDLPDHDFWLFDDGVAARMHFEQEQFVGSELVTEPAELARYLRWKNIACQNAVSFAAYVQKSSPGNQ